MPPAIEQSSAFDTGPRSSHLNGKPAKKTVRPALAASLGQSRRRFVDHSGHRDLLFELDQTSVDVAFVLRLAGIWDCLPRAQKSRIKRLPLLVLTSAGRISIEGDRQRRR